MDGKVDARQMTIAHELNITSNQHNIEKAIPVTMSIRIDAQELRELLALVPVTQNIMLIGRHGIGKSQIITDFYRRLGQRVVTFFLGQMSDPGDLIGLPHKDEASGHSVFLPPFWWPLDEAPIVLFLDELNRARPELLQAVQDLALNRTLAGRVLPAGSRIIAAVNEGEAYQLTDLDPAMVSRFNLYEFAPTVEDWLVWATDRGLDQRVIYFIQQQPGYLDGDPSQTEAFVEGLVKTPDRRAWAKVAEFVADRPTLDDLAIKIVAGMVGTTAAMAFRQSLKAAPRVTPEQVLLNFSRHKKKLAELSLHELADLNEQMLLWMHGKNYPEDQFAKVQRNLLAYLRYHQEQKRQEVVAHCANLLQDKRFEAVLGRLAQDLETIEFLTDYIQGIRV